MDRDVLSMLGWGAVGGALPTLSKIAGTYGANFDAPTPRIAGVTIAIAMYAVIGSIVARAMNNPEMRQALFAGIAAPAIVVSIITGVTDSRTLRADSLARTTHFVGSANAQSTTTGTTDPRTSPVSPTSGTKSPNRTILIEAASVNEVYINGDIRIIATVPGRGQVSVGSLEVFRPYQRTSIEVPTDATALSFVAANGTSAQLDTNSASRIMLQISPKTSTGQDLLWALGSKRSFDIGGLSATYDSVPGLRSE